MRSPRSPLLSMLLALSLTGVLQADDLFESLAGPGENLLLETGRKKDGSLGVQNLVRNADGSITTFEAFGRTRLVSPRIDLECYALVYDPELGVLEAVDEVIIRQEGVYARSARMVYNLETGEVQLSGDPYVEQENEANRSVFQGMEVFSMVPREDGSSEIQMSGGELIDCHVLPREGTGTPTPSPSPVPVAGGAPQATLPSGTGFAGLGDDVRIRTRPRENQQPVVNISTTPIGEFELFRAEGSVVLESETMNLRSDELEFDGLKQEVEALHNVYIKQDGIEADCGRMLYELEKGRMELSINPDIREKREDGSVTRIQPTDAYVITRAPDGTVTTQSIGTLNKMERIAAPASEGENASNAPAGPQEIRLDSDEDLTRIGTTTPRR